jgi:hypothetical protein
MKVYELLATPDKWIQGRYDTGDGRHCILGAVDACYDPADQCHIRTKLRGALGRSIIGWNDAPERTHAEVLALCKELDI